MQAIVGDAFSVAIELVTAFRILGQWNCRRFQASQSANLFNGSGRTSTQQQYAVK
ncbi:hypothetical protein GYRE_00799 [Yokenella regensburgei ATCC 49455]|nr:hypothetical protein GYRE_00799 [Yokenella regensburgei ATCC 49455]